MFKVNIYIETDNGSRKKLYRGYGASIEYIRKNRQKELRFVSNICYGTWNLAYILALTEALNLLKSPCIVTIYCDNETTAFIITNCYHFHTVASCPFIWDNCVCCQYPPLFRTSLIASCISTL